MTPMLHRGRRSIRLKDFDYRSTGAYFVTICTLERTCLFGEVVDGRMHLNPAGRIVYSRIDALPRHFRHVRIDAYVVMPNHVHIVMSLHDTNNSRGEASADWNATAGNVEKGALRCGNGDLRGSFDLTVRFRMQISDASTMP